MRIFKARGGAVRSTADVVPAARCRDARSVVSGVIRSATDIASKRSNCPYAYFHARGGALKSIARRDLSRRGRERRYPISNGYRE
jgi:hypothetical protein